MLFQPRHKPSFLYRAQNMIWPRIGLGRAWRYLWHRLARIKGTPHVIAIGCAAGAFASFTPFVGFHFILAGVLALLVGGNVLASALGTFVGNPITFPFIWLSTFNLGGFLLGYETRDKVEIGFPDGGLKLMFTQPGEFFSGFWSAIESLVWPMLLGGVPLGVVCATAVYFISYPVVASYQHRRRERLARRRMSHSSMTELQ